MFIRVSEGGYSSNSSTCIRTPWIKHITEGFQKLIEEGGDGLIDDI